MGRFLSILLALFLTFPPGAQAVAQEESTAAAEADQDPAVRLDRLFTELKRERNERAARRLALRIGRAWTESGSATADLLMQWANDAIKDENFPVALDFLDQVVALYPGYAEGWNRRATVHFMTGDHARSMSDIARTLELEPRHFGALSGMARILQESGRKEQALDVYTRILEIYPMLRPAQEAVATLSDDLAGRGI